MWLRGVLPRALVVAAAALVSGWLASRMGVWAGVGAWTVIIGVLCAAVALLLSRQALGRITCVNVAAGALLPCGYAISGGRLPQIVLVSWMCWIGVGASAAVIADTLVFTPQSGVVLSREMAVTVAIALFASWIVCAAAIGRMASGMVKAGVVQTGRWFSGVGKPIAVLSVALAVSVTLLVMGRPVMALAVAAAPIVIVGGGYGLVLVVMLTAGRKARWH